jgi:hypothetical protein
MTGKHTLHHLPLRKLGFENAPAVPVDLPGMADTLVRLGIKVKQYQQALQGLGRTYTIRGTVRRLLEPQSSFLIPFDDVLLLQWSAAAPPTSIATGRQFLQLVDRYADGRRFFDDDPLRHRLRREARAGHAPDLAVGKEHRAMRQGAMP